MSELVTAETFYNKDGAIGSDVPVALWANTRFSKGMTPAQTDTLSDAAVAVAYVNEGRWVARCPYNCGEAQVVAESDQRFFCTTCGNFEADQALIAVTWPESHADIESALLPRPQVFRNWDSSETVDDLLAENAARGIG